MTTGIVLLRPYNTAKLTGTGTFDLDGSDRVAGYLNTDGSTTVTLELRDGSAAGDLLFSWESPLAISIWPIICTSKTVYYSVSGANGFLLLYPVVV